MAEIPPKLLPTDLDEKDQAKLDKTMTKLENRDIIIDDTAGCTPGYIDEKLANLKAIVQKCQTAGKYPTETALVCVDYLQLLRPTEKGRARYEEVDGMAYALRDSAKKYNFIIVLLVQLNREVDNRKSFEPRLSDLRESGGLEQAGDTILLLHRPSYYKMQEFGVDTPDDGEAFVIVAKNRQGPTGKMRCVWVP
jgi:replicative DNA helicase